MTSLMTVTTSERHVQVNQHLGNDSIVANNIDLCQKSLRNIQLDKNLSYPFVKDEVKILFYNDKPPKSIGNANKKILVPNIKKRAKQAAKPKDVS